MHLCSRFVAMVGIDFFEADVRRDVVLLWSCLSRGFRIDANLSTVAAVHV